MAKKIKSNLGLVIVHLFKPRAFFGLTEHLRQAKEDEIRVFVERLPVKNTSLQRGQRRVVHLQAKTREWHIRQFRSNNFHCRRYNYWPG